MYIAYVIQQGMTSFEFEDAVLNKCFPQLLLLLGCSKNTQQPRHFYFRTLLYHANTPSCNRQKMMKPIGDQLFSLAASNNKASVEQFSQRNNSTIKY